MADKLNPDNMAGHGNDAKVVFRIDEQKTKAWGDFYPALGSGHSLDMDFVKQHLSSQGLSSGILWEEIQEAVVVCNSTHKPLKDLEVARGKRPVREVPEYIKVDKKLFHEGKLFDEAERIDYKSITPFVFVHKNQNLAHLFNSRPGRPGTDVCGQPIPFGRKEILQVRPGKNTRLVEDRVVALCDGRFIRQGNDFWVEEVLDIKGNVDYHTGHINFSGDVKIAGTVKEGFRVYAGGSIFCKKTIEACQIISKKDLFVGLGVKGKELARLRVAGKTEARFLESVALESRGSVFVHGSILNSYIKTLDWVHMGERGKIVGGVVKAINGVEAYQLGNSAFQKTEIHCGIDFVASMKLKEIKQEYAGLAHELKTAHDAQQKPGGFELEEMQQQTEKLASLTREINRLRAGLYKNREALVKVKGRAYPGTIIVICGMIYTVETALEKPCFLLEGNRIVVKGSKKSGKNDQDHS